jgi:exopolysaccharide production protein ExoQ
MVRRQIPATVYRSATRVVFLRCFRWWYWAAAFVMLQSIAAFDIVDRIFYGEWLGKPGDKITQTLNLLLIASSLALFARGFWRARKIIRTSAILDIAVASYLLCSAAWSIDPAASERQGILYLFVVVGSIGIVGNLEGDDFMDLLAKVCFLAGVASLALLVVAPAYAFGGDGDFRGIFSQKNILGEAMTMGALACLHGLSIRKRKRWRSTAMLLVIITVALKSQSATSCLTIFIVCFIHAIIALMRKGGFIRVAAIYFTILLIPVTLLGVAYPDPLLAMIGKDPTLTGRTEIWSAVIPDIYQKPWLGWGYGAFWSPKNPAAMEIGESFHWFAPEAHNGLLEILVNVGVVGAAFLVFLLVRNIILGLLCLHTTDKALAISSLLCCASVVLVGVSETVLMVALEASTAVFFVTGLYCERALWLRKWRSAASRHRTNCCAVARQAATT